MNTQSNCMSECFEAPVIAPSAMSATRPLYWSIRREVWENRSVYVAPLAVAAVLLLAFLIASIGKAVVTPDPAGKVAVLSEPISFAATLLMLTTFIVGAIYCLDALHGEGRDRSILFWKSLPISDLTTVLSKASIPLVVLPLLCFVIVLATQVVMLELSTLVLVISGIRPATLWAGLPLFQMEVVLLYSLTVLALQYAPLYCWLLLISGWARRATILWAVLPPLAIGVGENITFHTSYFGSLLKDRLFGFAADAFDFKAQGHVLTGPQFISLTQLTPGKVLGSPGLWIGLGLAAVFLAAAARLRRYREPI
jgi:ABC-2 type transport system permease protein